MGRGGEGVQVRTEGDAEPDQEEGSGQNQARLKLGTVPQTAYQESTLDQEKVDEDRQQVEESRLRIEHFWWREHTRWRGRAFPTWCGECG